MDQIKIIARYTDGRMIKGHTGNFSPHRSFFHMMPNEGHEPVKLKMSELKAVFIVKDFGGNPRYRESRRFDDGSGWVSRKLKIQFSDGEVMHGSSMNYTPEAIGFFVQPADSNSNNDRVFIVNEAVETVSVQAGPVLVM